MTRPATSPSDGWQPAAASTNRTQPTPAIDKCREAEPVRRDHLRTWLAGAKPTPTITRWILAELLAAPPAADHRHLEQLRDLGWASDVLRPAPETPEESHGWPGPPSLQVNPAVSGPRATIGVLALLLADRELATGVHSWRTPNPDSATARYLDFLAQHTGYTLGEVEKIAAGHRRPGPRRFRGRFGRCRWHRRSARG